MKNLEVIPEGELMQEEFYKYCQTFEKEDNVSTDYYNECKKISEKLSECKKIQLLIRGKLIDKRYFTFWNINYDNNRYGRDLITNTLNDWINFMNNETDKKHWFSPIEQEYVNIENIGTAKIGIFWSK